MRTLVHHFRSSRSLLWSHHSRSLSSSSSSSNKLVGWRVNEETKIGTITLQSPETYNALTVEMGQEFSALCQQITHDLTIGQQDVNAIVLEGQGDDAFSAGGNFDWLRSLKHNPVHQNADIMLRFYNSFLCVRRLPVPVIGAIQGPAIGAGACLALACDLRTAAPKKKILGFTFSSLGIHSGMGGSHLLHRALGGPSAVINEILLTGKVLSGEEALQLGIVNRVAEDAKGAAYELAAKISTQHPVAIRTMLQTIRQRQDDGLEQTLQREALAQAICYNRDDWGEGVDAIAEKRDTIFDPYHEN
jgi:enoyl-CoA hydratase/carnithine racemase